MVGKKLRLTTVPRRETVSKNFWDRRMPAKPGSGGRQIARLADLGVRLVDRPGRAPPADDVVAAASPILERLFCAKRIWWTSGAAGRRNDMPLPMPRRPSTTSNANPYDARALEASSRDRKSQPRSLAAGAARTGVTATGVLGQQQRLAPTWRALSW
jgi:hypothetical protein